MPKYLEMNERARAKCLRIMFVCVFDRMTFQLIVATALESGEPGPAPRPGPGLSVLCVDDGLHVPLENPYKRTLSLCI